jgi:hypothetical protein
MKKEIEGKKKKEDVMDKRQNETMQSRNTNK